MANKSISELTAATQVNNADLFVLEQNSVAKKLTGQLLLSFLNAHGGIASTSYTAPVAPSLQGTLTLTFADGTSTSVPIMNGAKGDTGAQGAAFTYADFTPEQLAALKGEQGEQGPRGFTGNSAKVWIKYSSVEPTSDADMGDIPDAWMGIYSAAFDEPPAHYTDFDWYNIKGATGATGATGAAGDRGTYIWRSNYPVRGSDMSQYFLKSDLIAPTVFVGATPGYGDMIVYGDNYYFANSIGIGADSQKVYVSNGYSLNSAALPSGGTTGQVLGKASDNDFDVEWRDAAGGTYTVTYGTTSYSNMRQAEIAGKSLKLTYNSRRYTTVESTGGNQEGSYTFTSQDDDGTTYWCKCECVLVNFLPQDTWTNGSASGGGGASPYTSNPAALGTASPGSSSNYSRGDHVHPMPTAANVGAIAAPSSPATGAFLVYNGSAWTAQTLSTWQGGNY